MESMHGAIPICRAYTFGENMSLVDDFLSHLEVEQRCSLNTLEAYGRDLRQFAAWICGSDNPSAFDPASVTPADVRAWLGSMGDLDMTPATLRRKAQSLRAFYRWGMRRGTFRSNPAADLSLAKLRRHLPNFIREKELEQILKTDPEDFASHRAHIVLSMLYSLGLRQAELLALTDDDINLAAAEVRVSGKRAKQRVLPLPPSLADEIRLWQKIRDEHCPDMPAPRCLIAGNDGPLSRTTLYRIVRDALRPTSTGRKSPHTLRHSFATAMVNHGADLDAVREMLGHTSLATTQIYTHLSLNELLSNYRHSHPRSRPASRLFPDDCEKHHDEAGIKKNEDY